MCRDTIVRSALTEFRKKFVLSKDRLSGDNVNRWFPIHMYVSLRTMQAKLRSVDCVVEVHDARIPFSGRNDQFRTLLYAIRPHILVLNKCDLIDPKLRPRIERRLRETDKNLSHIIWTNCKLKEKDSIKELMRRVNENVEKEKRYNRELQTDYTLMVIGIPNVGKSSLINAIRYNAGLTSVATVGARPGVTRAVQEKIRIQASPRIYMLDTPGVLAPNIRNADVGMKMALCETVLQHLVGYDLMADYLLYRMNKERNFRYLKLTDLSDPTDDIRKLLFEIALKNKLLRQVKATDTGATDQALDLEGASLMFLNHFRSGKFGCQFMDRSFLDID